MTDFSAWTQACQARVENVLAEWLPPADIVPQRLHEAMRYAVLEMTSHGLAQGRLPTSSASSTRRRRSS